MKNLKKIHRIFDLTFQDLQHKSINALFASLLEEIGELARELKIALDVYGNTYKKPDEGVKGEAIDVYICCLAMHYAKIVGEKPTKIKHESCQAELEEIAIISHHDTLLKIPLNENVFRELRDLSIDICNSKFLFGADDALLIYTTTDGTSEEFWNYLSHKLDK
jgi:hypothetical protein